MDKPISCLRTWDKPLEPVGLLVDAANYRTHSLLCLNRKSIVIKPELGYLLKVVERVLKIYR